MEVMEILDKLMRKEAKVYVTKGSMEIGENIQSKVLAFAFSLAAAMFPIPHFHAHAPFDKKPTHRSPTCSDFELDFSFFLLETGPSGKFLL